MKRQYILNGFRKGDDGRFIVLSGPQVDVQVGETVAWQGGNEMGEFRSRTLNRTFDNILFVERIWVER